MNTADRAIRASTAVVVVGLAGVAAYVSYSHALEVVRAHGEDGTTATLMPLTIDGLVYVSSMVLLDSARRNVRAPGLARWTLGLGIAATVAANVLHGIAHGAVGAVIAAWPAVTLVLVYELLMMLIRGGAATTSLAPVVAPVELAAAPEDLTLDDPFDDVPAATLAWLRGEDQVRVPPVPDVEVRAAAVFRDEVERGEVPTVRQVKRKLRIGSARASGVRLYLADLARSRPVPEEAASR
jgi:hypothetical protein